MPTHLSPVRLPRSRARSARVACVLLFASMAGAGCSDQTGPTSPDPENGSVDRGAAEAKRTAIISDLQFPYYTLYVGPNGIALPVTYELTNPGGKTNELFVRGELRQGAVNELGNYAIIPCGGDVSGTVRHGTCRVGEYGLLVPTAGLQSGPAQFTFRLSRVVNNMATTLDTRTVDVYIIR